jgi:hypothetical protein
LAHCTPHAPGAQLFEADEYKAAYILNHEKLPTKPPTLNEVVRLVARLGGFWRAKVTASPASRPFGWACSASLTSPQDCGSHGNCRLRGFVYNEMG